jgi:hypothetical protein
MRVAKFRRHNFQNPFINVFLLLLFQGAYASIHCMIESHGDHCSSLRDSQLPEIGVRLVLPYPTAKAWKGQKRKFR